MPTTASVAARVRALPLDGGGASIASLFTALGASVPGDCWVFKPPYTWQNTARTVAAAVATDPIRYVDSAAGRTGALQALSDAARPTLGGFAGGSTLSAQFDGINNALQTVATLDMSSTDEVTVIAVGHTKASTNRVWCELGVSTLGAFMLYQNGSNAYAFRSIGSLQVDAAGSTAAPPQNSILIGRSKIGAPIVGITRSGGAETTNAASQGTGSFASNLLLNIGCRNAASPTLFANLDLAALCIVGRQPSNLPAGWLTTMTGLLVPPEATFT